MRIGLVGTGGSNADRATMRTPVAVFAYDGTSHQADTIARLVSTTGTFAQPPTHPGAPVVIHRPDGLDPLLLRPGQLLTYDPTRPDPWQLCADTGQLATRVLANPRRARHRELPVHDDGEVV